MDNQQINSLAEACIKFVKRTLKKWFETNKDVHLSLLQIKVTK